MDHAALNHWSKWAADWITDYHASLRDRPVRAPLSVGLTVGQLPAAPPDDPVDAAEIIADFEALIPNAMTHWQHPRFFAYFPANAAPASMLAEQLAGGIAAQCMLWQSSPAATELEMVMVGWLRQALGLGDHFKGTIQDSASTATLCAIVTMRERALKAQGNQSGLFGCPRVRIYCSDQTHSSIDKGVRIAGIGQDNLIRIETDDTLSMQPKALDAAIRADMAAGYLPAGVILSVGGTSVGGTDNIAPLIGIAKAHDLYTHVDAAWAGSAMICPEFRGLWDGVDGADSIVFNPAKWLGAQFDCSLQFLADPAKQVGTLSVKPDYLLTHGADEITDFNDWTVPLGRRFRALKLWFVIRAYGLDGLRARIRNHIKWSTELADIIHDIPDVEIVTAPRLSLFSFSCPTDGETADLLERINDDGRIYLTQTRHRGRLVIRMQVGQFDCTRADVMIVADVLRDLIRPKTTS